MLVQIGIRPAVPKDPTNLMRLRRENHKLVLFFHSLLRLHDPFLSSTSDGADPGVDQDAGNGGGEAVADFFDAAGNEMEVGRFRSHEGVSEQAA